MFMAPVSSMLAVSVIGRMLEKWSPGIYHLSADRDISYAEAAYAGADIMGVNPLQVQPISVSDIGIDQGSFPARTALNMDGLSSKFGVGPINARHTVEQYFINRTCRG